jgi:hypothetical protein
MTPRLSIIDLQNAALTLRAEEAVAIVQQLIHNLPNDRHVTLEQPFGPPTPQNVYLDEEGFVSCRACQTTPAVAETAILLQRLLPPGTPKVPGALRYAIARALHEVDAPPFDSIHDFSIALERFERGDRAAVVRALVARAIAVNLDRLRARHSEDRRRLMPSSTDFRRELRAADARYYELASATRHLTLTVPKSSVEQRRSPTLVAGVLAGVCLVFVGEVMHTRSGTTPFTPNGVKLAPAAAGPDVPDVPSPLPARHIVVAPVLTAMRVDPGLTAMQVDGPSRPAVKRVSRRPAQVAPSPASYSRRSKNGRGVMDRLHLGWLRSAFTIRHDPL